MKKRKLIGLISAFPESVYARRLMDGMFKQCSAYDYDVAVFAPMTQVCCSQQEYLNGELNIYNLINFELLDGVIIDGASIVEDNVQHVKDTLIPLLKERCTKPVVCIGLEFADYPVVYTSDHEIFRSITSHVMDVHGCKNVYFLTGQKGHPTSQDRLSGFTEELTARGIAVDDEKIFYGDFWYSGGAALADRIISGELDRPDAVICASDHMAIGLVNRLAEDGIRVPEDIVVTGFDATQEAAVNHITITSFVPNCSKTAAEAVDLLRGMIEPDADIIPYKVEATNHLRSGMSCGCNYDHMHLLNLFRESLYYVNRDYTRSDMDDHIDIGLLMESYMYEYLSGTDSPLECMHQIYNFTYLLRPYGDFWLCLDENWLASEAAGSIGYPMRMKNFIHCTPKPNSGHFGDGEVFDTALMLPQLKEYRKAPSVFYFTPVHFHAKTFGYAVIRCELSQEHKINAVYRNWLRNVNNALEMTRAHNRLVSLSTRDGMTGVYNRRGMELQLEEMLKNAHADDCVLSFVIDMDRLKFINDTYGHEEGDFGINAVCEAARRITYGSEICVRAGGDEFYVLGIGKYTDADIDRRMEIFAEALRDMNRSSDKPYEISASIGSACVPISSGMHVTGIIRIADAKMYENKVRKKQQRI